MTNGRPGGTCPAGGQHDTAASGPYAVNAAAPPRGNQPVRKPQLFLVETYQLNNFRAALLRDEMLATLQSLLPHQTITCRMFTRKRTSEEMKQGSTVLDSQSSESAQRFNDSLKQSSDQTFGTNEYNYAMQSNFAGKVSVGLGSGSAQAQLNVAGGTTNVRNELANSVDTALDSQVSQANQARREAVRVASGESKVETTTETEMTITTTNPTDQVQNYAIYQLRQEHVSILSLVDVEVAFLNGEPKSTQRVPLFRLDELLNAVIAEPAERATVKAQIRACLSAIRDNNDQAQSIIAEDPGQAGGFVVNKKARSRYELRHADGAVRQVLSAPGVILRAVTKQLKKPGATVVASIQ